jgi:molybdopterin-guanine dinucleotide biosynthesis protein A
MTTVKHKSCKKKTNKREYLFHPYELAFTGHSGSGKTKLITRLIKILSEHMSIAYIKHDAHFFEMDHEGKDTDKAWKSGASCVSITDKDHTALIQNGIPNKICSPLPFLQADIAFIEGYKDFATKKILVLDAENTVLEGLSESSIESIVAYVGENSQAPNLPSGVPYFQRDQIEAIKNFILNSFQEQVKAIPLYGLLLAGGFSTRMQTDKALLKYSEKTQTEIGYELLDSVCESSYVSVRSEQWDSSMFPELPRIEDRFLDFGPMGGILSAMHAHPEAAWLVIACDLPYLNPFTLEHLIEHRNPLNFASAYKSSSNRLPEPLCAIYEPKAYAELFKFVGMRKTCPRCFLRHVPTNLLTLPDTNALDNINTVEEYEQCIMNRA